QSSPDSIKVGKWLFRHRTSVPLPFAIALLWLRVGEAHPSWTLTAAGVILTGGGELLRLLAVHHIGGISRTRSDRLGPLITTGPFAVVRNPLYLGNIAIWVGFAVTARLVWLAPIIAVLLLAEYDAIVRWEEALLESRHGEAYRLYASRVARWLPAQKLAAVLATAVPAPPAVAAFTWRETFFSERGTLVAIAVGCALLWLKFEV